MSTFPAHRNDLSRSMKCPARHAGVYFGVPQRWTRCAGTVDTAWVMDGRSSS
ncbi:hypothetical protein [Kibdelosporangium philippinense]|uniref:hypothetical protein n=1 Tax=Kibdelosporangium philippinense TaxID=211113 RepID=UPI0036230C1F